MELSAGATPGSEGGPGKRAGEAPLHWHRAPGRPYEDQVRVFAQHVRAFAENIDGTHQAASSTVGQMSAAYQGSSYEQLVASWARMSSDHMRELVDACHTVATAVDVAADAIVAAKLAALGELAALAASLEAITHLTLKLV